MRTLLLFGSLAAGVLLFIYEFYQSRNTDHEEAPHGYGGAYMDHMEDVIDIDTTEPNEVQRRIGPNRSLPGREEVCSICLDKLVRQDADCKYCIIALPECGHWFHQKCAIRLLEYHPMCPVCRTKIDGSRLRGTPVRVLQASDGEQDQQPQHQEQQPVAGGSGAVSRPVGYQSDDDLD